MYEFSFSGLKSFEGKMLLKYITQRFKGSWKKDTLLRQQFKKNSLSFRIPHLNLGNISFLKNPEIKQHRRVHVFSLPDHLPFFVSEMQGRDTTFSVKRKPVDRKYIYHNNFLEFPSSLCPLKVHLSTTGFQRKTMKRSLWKLKYGFIGNRATFN